jgi:hypothetical protein
MEQLGVAALSDADVETLAERLMSETMENKSVIAFGERGSGSGRKTGTKPSSVKQEPPEATMREVDHA